jgi:hypothetical protein
MKSKLTYFIVLSLCVFGLFFATTSLVEAAILSLSAAAPTVNGADIANLGGTLIDSGADGDTFSIWDYQNRPAQGQTFATGSNPAGYTLNAITLQAQDRTDQLTFPHVPFNVYVSSVSGATGETATRVAFEASSNTVDIAPLNFVTATLATPVHLNPDTQYAVDWEGLWAGALPDGNSGRGMNLTQTADLYSAGSAYSRWEHAVTSPGGPGPARPADPTALQLRSSIDQVFHLDITAVPEPSSLVLFAAGLFGLFCYARRERR